MKQLQEYLNSKGYNLTIDGQIGEKTKTALLTYIIKTYTEKKYRSQNKMLVWIRTDENLTNTFDDFCVLIINYKIEYVCKATTTAGDHYIFNPITSGGITGTAITRPQQIIEAHEFTTSKNWSNLWLGMPYFKQIKPLDVYRDWNKDRKIDTLKKTFGIYGINLHQMGLGNLINNWSAGCNGTSKNDWTKIVQNFTAGEKLDYTLI
jgi:peptidoglycan hydrolase-like protein with peptidoglycan-binding domain